MPARADIREVLLTVVQEHERRAPNTGNLQQATVLDEVARRLGVTHTTESHVAVLTLWNDLFRTGYLGWGLDLNNPGPPFFHITERGRQTIERLSRDPGNPAGYARHLASVAKLNAIAQSYLSEGLECFVAGLYKAAAVMLGAAAESLVLEARDTTVATGTSRGISIPKALNDWKLKAVLDSLQQFLGSRAHLMPRELREDFEALWPALTHQIRVVRNDAGHPASVDPVSADSVHASFLLFPDLARLATRVNAWVAADLR